jgi:broad specificity phosphatase PhoE
MNNDLANISGPEFNCRAGMGGKKIKHRIIFVRHGETLSNISIMNNETNTLQAKKLNTPLSVNGYQQAENIATLFKNTNFKPNKIIMSCLDRVIYTANPTIKLFENDSVPIIVDNNIVEFNDKFDEEVTNKRGHTFLYAKETKLEFIARINNFFNTELLNIGTINDPYQTIVFTHSQVISCILTNSLTNYENDVNVFFHISNASISCIDIDENNKIHIHVINYTKHLDNPTGYHMPFI